MQPTTSTPSTSIAGGQLVTSGPENPLLKRKDFLSQVTPLMMPVARYYYEIAEKIGVPRHLRDEIQSSDASPFIMMESVLREWLNNQNRKTQEVTAQIIIDALNDLPCTDAKFQKKRAKAIEGLQLNSALFNVERTATYHKAKAKLSSFTVTTPSELGTKRKLDASSSSTSDHTTTPKRRKTTEADPTFGMGLSLMKKEELLKLAKKNIVENIQLRKGLEEAKKKIEEAKKEIEELKARSN